MRYITEHQQKIIELAKLVLSPYNKEVTPSYITYFEIQDKNGDCRQELESENDCCNDDKCIKTQLKLLRKEFKKKIGSRYQYSGDYDYFKECSICYKPLNDSINFSYDELNHQIKNHNKLDSFKSSNSSMQIIAVLDSFRSSEYNISTYEKNDIVRFNNAILKEKNKIKRVVRYCKKIINTLFPLTKDEIKNIEWIGGLYTILGESVKDNPKIIKAKFLKAEYLKENTEGVKWNDCWMVGDYHAMSLEEANAKIYKDALIAREKKKEVVNFNAKLKQIYFYRDCRKAGNCRDGIIDFCQKAKLNLTKGYSGKVLLKKAKEYNLESYVTRMIKY